jgi:hypothetical protein
MLSFPLDLASALKKRKPSFGKAVPVEFDQSNLLLGSPENPDGKSKEGFEWRDRLEGTCPMYKKRVRRLTVSRYRYQS